MPLDQKLKSGGAVVPKSKKLPRNYKKLRNLGCSGSSIYKTLDRQDATPPGQKLKSGGAVVPKSKKLPRNYKKIKEFRL